MNFEGLENIRSKAIEAVLDALVKIVNDEKQPVEARLKAAARVDSISDTMVHAYLISDAVKEDASTKNKLLKNLDKLHNNEDDN